MEACCGCLCCCCGSMCICELYRAAGPYKASFILLSLWVAYSFIPYWDLSTTPDFSQPAPLQPSLSPAPIPIPLEGENSQWLGWVALFVIVIALRLGRGTNKTKAIIWRALAWYGLGYMGEIEGILGSFLAFLLWFGVYYLLCASIIETMARKSLPHSALFSFSLFLAMLYRSFFSSYSFLAALSPMMYISVSLFDLLQSGVYAGVKYMTLYGTLGAAGALVNDAGNRLEMGKARQIKATRSSSNEVSLYFSSAILEVLAAVFLLHVFSHIWYYIFSSVPWILDIAAASCFSWAAAAYMIFELKETGNPMMAGSEFVAVLGSIWLEQLVIEAVLTRWFSD